MKIIKKNKFYTILILLLLFFSFSKQFFLSQNDNSLKFGSVGSNFFFKKYSNSPELEIYLNQKKKDYSNLSIKELCEMLNHITYELKKPIKLILISKGIKNCNN